jgi:hypothetical protein
MTVGLIETLPSAQIIIKVITFRAQGRMNEDKKPHLIHLSIKGPEVWRIKLGLTNNRRYGDPFKTQLRNGPSQLTE